MAANAFANSVRLIHRKVAQRIQRSEDAHGELLSYGMRRVFSMHTIRCVQLTVASFMRRGENANFASWR